MQKIKDRVTLSIVAGLIGLVGLTLTDEISQRAKISKRSFRQAAAGVFVSKKEAKKTTGQVLGIIMNSAVSIIGADYIIKRMSQNGRDKLFFKGITTGIIFGAIVTVIPNLAHWNKMKPKDAASNLSYVFSNMVFGLLATFTAAILGHDSLFDTPPQNNYLKPTELTSEQIKELNRTPDQPMYSDIDLN